ncbi:MAG: DMT family transporter [Candidatus Zixiibacteriota bacterium]
MIGARLLLLLCVIFWGWSFVATKIAVEYVNPFELLAIRYILGLPILLVVFFSKKIKFNFEKRDKIAVLLGSTIITIHFLIQITGLKYTSATNTGWIISISPLVMALLAFLILKEKITSRQIIGIIVATIGIVLLVSRGNFMELDWLSSTGDWLVLASACTWAFYSIATRFVSQRQDPLAVTLGVLGPSAVLVILYVVLNSDWSKFLHLPLEPVLALTFLGVFAMGLAQWFWQAGMAKVGAARAGIFLYLEPLATTALAVPYLNEEFGLISAIGGILVLLGVFVAEKKN